MMRGGTQHMPVSNDGRGDHSGPARSVGAHQRRCRRWLDQPPSQHGLSGRRSPPNALGPTSPMINGQTARASRPCWKNARHWDLIEHFGSGESSAGTAAEVSCALARLAPPLIIGSDAWVRSRACTEDFSSARKAIAFSGGFTQSPTASTSFSPVFGSLDSLNVSTRCGLRLRADHTCCTVDFDSRSPGSLFPSLAGRFDEVRLPGADWGARRTVSARYGVRHLAVRPSLGRACTRELLTAARFAQSHNLTSRRGAVDNRQLLSQRTRYAVLLPHLA